MLSGIFKCVLFPRNNSVKVCNNTKSISITKTDNIRFCSLLKNVDKLSLIINASEDVDSVSSSKKLVTLKTIYSHLNHKFTKKQKVLNVEEEKLDYYDSILNDILVSLNGSRDLNFKTKASLISVLVGIEKVSNNAKINGKIRQCVQDLTLSMNEKEIVKILKRFIRYNYTVESKVLLNRLNQSKNIESDVCFSLYWCLSTLGVEFNALLVLLERMITQVEITNVTNSLKLLNSLHISFSKVNPEGFKNNIILSNNIHSCDEPSILEVQRLLLDKIKLYRSADSDAYVCKLSGSEEKQLLNDTIRYVKRSLLNKLNDFDNSRALCNFIYYVTSTINDFTITNYNQLLERLINIIRDRRDIAIEGLIQLMWSLQKNSVYHYNLIQILISEFNAMLQESIGMGSSGLGHRKLNIGQISLFLYGLSYFNQLDVDLSTKALSFLKKYFSKNKDRNTNEVLKQINVIWAICITNVNSLDQINKHIVECLNNVDWDLYISKSEFEDLRKLMQVITVLKLEGLLDDLHIPDHVIKMVVKSGTTSVDYRINSVTQDKVRRILQSRALDFKSEYEINSHMSVDFIIFPQDDVNINTQNGFNNSSRDGGTVACTGEKKLTNRLVIEIDGPFHYNLLLDSRPDGTYDTDEIAFGGLKLILNGKTIYRNKILKRLGYNVVSIPWFVGYQKSFYHMIQNILNQHVPT